MIAAPQLPDGTNGPTSASSGPRLAVISVGANSLLAALNLVIGSRGGSLTVVASGIEFGADVAASLAVLFGFWYASRPADSNHPYGHGRAETLIGFLIGLALFLIGGSIAAHAVRDIDAVHAPPAVYTLWPLALALAVKAVMMVSKMRVEPSHGQPGVAGRRLERQRRRVVGGGRHHRARPHALRSRCGFARPITSAALLVGVFVIIAGLGVVRSTSLDLIDTMPPESLLNEVRQAACTVDGVRGVEKLFARRTGLQYHVDLHLEVDGWISVDAGHAIATAVRERIRIDVAAVSDVLVHVEPAGLGQPLAAQG